MILAYFGPGFVAVVLLVMSGCAGVAYLATKLLARIKKQFVGHDGGDSVPRLGWARWIASIVLGSGVVLGWGFAAFYLVSPLRGEMIAAPYTVGLSAVCKHDKFAELCAAGLIALLAMASQFFPARGRQWPVVYGTRKVVASVGWFAACYVTMVSLFA